MCRSCLRFQASTGAVECVPHAGGGFCAPFAKEGVAAKGGALVRAMRPCSGCKFLSSPSSVNTQG